MGTINCPVVNCGLNFKNYNGLAVHIAKKHPNFKSATMKMMTVTLPAGEEQVWKKIAEEHNMNLSDYVRFLVREGIEGKEEQRKLELEKKYSVLTDKLENEKIEISQELEAMKKFFVQHMNKTRKSKTTRATLWMLRNFSDFSKDLEKLEEQHISNKLIESEWNSLNYNQQALVKGLSKKIPFVAAIKKVKRDCSKDFEAFFKGELA